ncbi:hypothetical protein Patl1_23194 [Pistacia atlantica]|uniref:Uncharacterized protein n=1 Tax=Pistacia atlantica TaxID=434234 RepID=A0ACC0ZWZ1_9ROSI|nr:hypothetical protein Patl1_23194 [Pistacia atlantica]
MANSQVSALTGCDQDNHDKENDLKAFDNTKAGVKGLVDTGIQTIPKFFVAPAEETCSKICDFSQPHLSVPVIDLKDTDTDPARRKQVVEAIGLASNTWGFFQVVNHEIPQSTIYDVIQSIQRFHEQPNHVKEKFYSREKTKKVRFISNFDLYKARFANWRDTLFCHMAPNPPPPEEYPEACREMLMKFSESVKKLGENLFELLSEALGLKSNRLTEMGCADGHVFFCHYYPGCPEPDRTLGHTKHCDPDFLTILLQDQIGGLQVLHDETQWIDIPPVEGALVVNIGELLQLISNDKFKAAEHRVLANCSTSPRISVACFFTTHFDPSKTLFGPIKELSEDSLPLYRETSVMDYIDSFNTVGLGGVSSLARLRL